MQRIYEFIESYLTEGYSVTYQIIDETQKDVIGIFLYQGQEDEYALDGCIAEYIKVHIEMNCDNTSECIVKGMNDMRETAKKLDEAYDTDNGLDIEYIKVLNKCIPVGRNEHGVYKITSNFELKFNLTEVI